MSHMLRAVIFDLDDTLFDWSRREGSWRNDAPRRLHRLYAHLANAGHSLPSLEWFARVYVEQTAAAWDYIGPPDWIAPHQGRILAGVLWKLGIDAGDMGPDDLVQLLEWDVPKGVVPYPETADTLRALRGAGLRLGLLTNASLPMRIRDVELDAFGLKTLLDVRVSAADVGRLKPHPAPFLYILDRLGVKPREGVFVGDLPSVDITGAQGVGMRAVWRRQPERSLVHVCPDAAIDSLDALLPLFDAWYPGWRTDAQSDRV
jgi:HAD superfamily hydrolase (TIGR01509 family)